MPSSHVAIDSGALQWMYVDKQMTTEAIAQQLRCRSSTVRRRLRSLGIQVRSRGPNMERLRTPRPMPSPTWSREMAWIVGLIATDGNLAHRPRGISITSKDVDLLEAVRRCLALSNRLVKTTGRLGVAHRLQWRNRGFYDWLLSIGLTPRKSLTIGPLTVPDEYFADFLRGCIDGDGSVLVYTDRYHTQKKEAYVYQRLYVSLVSASFQFVEWIQASVTRLAHVGGVIGKRQRPGQRPIWNLRYAKEESIRILRWMYYASDVPCLMRKRVAAEQFLVPLGESTARCIGRPRVGWLYNAQAESYGGNRPGWRNGSRARFKIECP
jgi:hypothetical protein